MSTSAPLVGRIVRGDAKTYQVEIGGEIRTFVSLGFKPHQFTYQTSSLMLARESLPVARPPG